MSAVGLHMYRARITFPARKSARTVFVRGATPEEAYKVAHAVATILNRQTEQSSLAVGRARVAEVEATYRWTPLGGAVDPFVREVTLEEAILWALQGGET